MGKGFFGLFEFLGEEVHLMRLVLVMLFVLFWIYFSFSFYTNLYLLPLEPIRYYKCDFPSQKIKHPMLITQKHSYRI
jgi:hypothetical protein